MTFSLRNNDTTFVNKMIDEKERNKRVKDRKKLTFSLKRKLNYMDSTYMETNYTEE